MKNKSVIVVVILITLIIGSGLSSAITYSVIKNKQDEQIEKIETLENKNQLTHMIKRMPDDMLKSYSKNYIGDERLFYLMENHGVYEPTNTLTGNSYYIFDEKLEEPYIEINNNKKIFHFKDEAQIDKYLRSKNKK